MLNSTEEQNIKILQCVFTSQVSADDCMLYTVVLYKYNFLDKWIKNNEIY